jgi:hypothetical protein
MGVCHNFWQEQDMAGEALFGSFHEPNAEVSIWQAEGSAWVTGAQGMSGEVHSLF